MCIILSICNWIFYFLINYFFGLLFFFFKCYYLFLKRWVYLNFSLARFYSRIYSHWIFRYERETRDFFSRFPTFRARIASSIHHDDDADDFLRHWPFLGRVRYHLIVAYDVLAMYSRENCLRGVKSGWRIAWRGYTDSLTNVVEIAF